VQNESYDCPIEVTLEIIGKKWTVLILRELFRGRKRFTEISTALPISSKLLASRLKELEVQKIVTRTIYSEIPPRVEYTLTESGRTLDTVLQSLRCWGTHHIERTGITCREPKTTEAKQY